MKPVSRGDVSSASLRGSFSLKTTVESSVAVIDSHVAAFIELNWLGSVKPLPRPVITVKVIFNILGRHLSPGHRCLVMPVNALADVDNDRGGVRSFPAFRQIRFHDANSGTYLLVEAKFIPIYSPVPDGELLCNGIDAPWSVDLVSRGQYPKSPRSARRRLKSPHIEELPPFHQWWDL